MELFTIYAPQAPWNPTETTAIFQQTIRQLANLAHTTPSSSSSSSPNGGGGSSSSKNHFYQYYRILELLAEVKIGVIMVDLYNVSDDDDDDEHDDSGGRHNRRHNRVDEKNRSPPLRGSKKNSPAEESKLTIDSQLDDDDGDDNGSDDTDLIDDAATHRSNRSRRSTNNHSVSRREALDVLCELFRTLLNSVRLGHPPEIADYSQKALVACVEEFFDNGAYVPVPILDEILFCIGQGQHVLVLEQPKQQPPSSALGQSPVGGDENSSGGSSNNNNANNNNANSNNKRKSPRHGEGTNEDHIVAAPPIQVPVKNPSFLVAAAVLRRTKERLSHPIATLLSGLVDSSHRQMTESTISNLLEDNEDDGNAYNDEDKDGEDNDDDPADDDRTSPRAKKRQRGTGNAASDKTGKNNTRKKKYDIDRRREQSLQRLMDIVENLGDAQLQQQSHDDHTSNVWSIIYHMHKVAPSILTTVIGHLQNHLGSSNFALRILVVQTLGKLFSGTSTPADSTAKVSGGMKNDGTNPSTRMSLALEYAPCYRAWLSRHYDSRKEIRRIMIPHLLKLAKAGGALGGGNLKTHHSSIVGSTNPIDPNSEVAREAQEILHRMLEREPNFDLRLKLSEGLCDLSIRYRHILKDDLMLAIGEQAMLGGGSQKNRMIERRTALTGLVQIYHRQYIKHHLHQVLEGGDDCPIEVVLQVLRQTCRPVPPTPQFSLSQTTASSCSLTSSKRSRKSRSIDDDVVDDDESTDGSDYDYYQWIPSEIFEALNEFKDSEDPETHSRVVQLVDDMLLGSDLPYFKKKYNLTSTARAVGLAIVVNSVQNRSLNAWMGLNGMLETRSKLQKALKAYLEARGHMRSFAAGSEGAFEAEAMALDLLEKVAKMIPPPPGPAPAIGELHDVLERFHLIKDKHVFRILGPITGPDHSTKARNRAFDELPKRVKTAAGDAAHTWVKTLVKRCTMGDFMNQDVVQHCIVLAQECFEEDDFEASKYFLNCLDLAGRMFPKLCAGKDIFAGLTSMFEDCSSQNLKGKRKQAIQKAGIVSALSAILAAVTPHRAKNDKTDDDLEGSLQKRLLSLIREGTPEEVRNCVAAVIALSKPQHHEFITEEHFDAIVPTLKILASPSRLVVDTSGLSPTIPCILAGLAVFGEHAPALISSSTLGRQTLKFALDTILLGRSRIASTDDDECGDQDNSDSSDDYGAEISAPTQRHSLVKSRTPSTHCSSLLSKDSASDSGVSMSCRALCAAIEFLAVYIRSSIMSLATSNVFMSSNDQLIEKVFDTLSQILDDGGMAPSFRDRKACSHRQCRAALRRTAAIWLLRLCETRLGLDQKYLTTPRWHILAGSFLDDEGAVREGIMSEFIDLMAAAGVYYGRPGKQPIRLRFLAYLSLCVDDNTSNSVANGGAANVGKHCVLAKKNGLEFIVAFRQVYDNAVAQARVQGEDAEQLFERTTKLSLLPEYVLPYVISLLTFRDETPSSTDDQVGIRVLKKRLKNVLETLVASLGSNADNISFLLRCCEIISEKEPKYGGEKESLKMKLVCSEARGVLLSMVRSDVNLASYPGQMYMPVNLFSKKRKKVALKEVQSIASSPSSTYGRKRSKTQAQSSDYSTKAEGLDADSPQQTDGQSPFSTSTRSNSTTKNHSPEMKLKTPMPEADDEESFFSDSLNGRPSSSPSKSPSVRFSLDSQLSPIRGEFPRHASSPMSPAPRNADFALLDSGEKTTTPASNLKPFSATSNSNSSTTPISVSASKENRSKVKVVRSGKKGILSPKVKIVRADGKKVDKLSNPTNTSGRLMRNRGKKTMSNDPFQF